jgi:ATP-dependent Clp protease ATP-binding subunit ClpB
VILLDEIEKAHADVFNILLQVLEDGRLTDGHGRTVDFKNTVIVMTSNLGSAMIQELTGTADHGEVKVAVMNVVTQHFRPEFINRIDEIVVFSPLNKTHIRQITDIQLVHLKARLKAQNLDLEASTEVLDKLAEVGYDAVYGARPLKRAVRQNIENPLAEALLEGQFMPGDTIQLVIKNDKIAFQKGQRG